MAGVAVGHDRDAGRPLAWANVTVVDEFANDQTRSARYLQKQLLPWSVAFLDGRTLTWSTFLTRSVH